MLSHAQAGEVTQQQDQNISSDIGTVDGVLLDSGVRSLSLKDATEYALEHNKQLDIKDSLVQALKVKEEEVLVLQSKAKMSNMVNSVIDILLKKGHTLALTRYQKEVAEKNSEQERLILFKTVQNNYFNLKSAIKKYEKSQGITKYALENLKAVELKYNVGLASELELLGAKTMLIKATADQNAAERAVILNQMTFNRSIGLPVFTNVNLTEDISMEKYEEVNLNEKTKLALENRMEMFMAKKVFELDSIYIKLFEEYSPKNTYVYRIAFADTQTAELYVSLAEDGVRQSVYKSYFDMVNAYDAVQVLEENETQAQKIYDIAVIKYNAGMAPNNDVTDALNKLHDAQINKEHGLLAYKLAKITFEQSYGIGIGNDQIPYKAPQGSQDK